METKVTFEGQVCLDGFNCQQQLMDYLERNGSVVRLELYGGQKVVAVIKPLLPVGE